MTYEEYLNKKEDQKKIYISKVFSLAGDVDEEQLMKEAEEKFEREYPKFKRDGII